MNFFNNPFNNRNNENEEYNQQSSIEPEGNNDSLTDLNENNLENTNKNSFKAERRVKTNATMDFETLQKAKQDLVGEIQSIIEYYNHIHSTTNKLAIITWENIKSEELIYVGELMALLNYLHPTQRQYIEKGVKIFTEKMS